MILLSFYTSALHLLCVATLLVFVTRISTKELDVNECSETEPDSEDVESNIAIKKQGFLQFGELNASDDVKDDLLISKHSGMERIIVR